LTGLLFDDVGHRMVPTFADHCTGNASKISGMLFQCTRRSLSRSRCGRWRIRAARPPIVGKSLSDVVKV
jgi:hypothetical protein